MRFEILCIKHTHKLFLSFFPFFSFFVLFSFFFLFLLGFVCWALLSVYTGHIFQGRTLFFVCGAHRLFPTQSPPSPRGEGGCVDVAAYAHASVSPLRLVSAQRYL